MSTEKSTKGAISLDTAFFRDLSSATFNTLAEFHSSMESQLSSAKTRERENINRQIEALGLIGDERYVEYGSAMEGYEAKYEMLFTNFFRFSYITLLALALEDWLARLCRAVQDIKKLLEGPPQPQRGIVASFRSYLEEAGVLIEDGLWEAARDLYSVRNCVVHHSGNVLCSSSRDRQRIESLVGRTYGIRISDHHTDEEAIPLYLEDGMMIIDAGYCASVTTEVQSLFTRLCDAIPLHRITFE